jgi:predicted membrane GTPase involved in stress response
MDKIKNIFIEKSAKTPQIDFNQLTGELIFYGRSIPENAAKIYEPLLDWINDYVKSPHNTTNLRLNLEYFNTASSIWIAKIITALSKISKDNSVLFIHLYFDIEDFESMDMEELKDIIGPLVDNIGEGKISIGIKTYGKDADGKAVKESTIFI